MRFFRYLLIIIALFVIPWCWSEDVPTITFDKYSIEFPNQREEMAKSLIEHDSSSFKIVTILKAKEKTWMRNNIIISKEILKKNTPNIIDLEEYSKYLIEKLKREIIWLKIETNNQFEFSDKKAYYTTYKVNENVLQDIEKIKYWGFQIYLLDWDIWYTISWLFDNKDSMNEVFATIQDSLILN